MHTEIIIENIKSYCKILTNIYPFYITVIHDINNIENVTKYL